MANTETIQFDVGGTVYKVSRSLVLEKHPDTMLARLVSEMWRGSRHDDDTKAAVFVEGDGERFRYVLDYMRYGKVTLPSKQISKEAFLTELDYYGFVNVARDSVTVACTVIESAECLRNVEKELMEEQKKRAEQQRQAEFSNGCSEIALEMFKAFKKNHSHDQCLKIDNLSDHPDPSKKRKYAAAVRIYRGETQLLNESFAKFGLKIKKVNRLQLRILNDDYNIETTKLED